MVKRYYKLIRAKIFAIVLGVLLLLLAVAYFSTVQLKKLNNELQDLAHYSIPITDLMATVNVHVLEQELHVTRLLRLYSEQKIRHAAIEQQLIGVKQRGQSVHKALDKAMALSQRALTHSARPIEQVAFTRFTPLLEQIKVDYQQAYTHILTAVQRVRMSQGEKQEVEALQTLLAQKKTQFDQKISHLLHLLEQFSTQAAQTAEQHERAMLQVYLLVTGITIALALLFAFLMATRMTRAIRKLTVSVNKIAAENYDTRIEQLSNDEVGKLSASFNHMFSELKMKAAIEAQFAQHVDPRIVEKIINDPAESRTGGKKQQMTVFFSGIADTNDQVSSQTALEMIARKNHYYQCIAAAIVEHQGVVDKFIDATVMAFWGEPFVAATEHSTLACLAALAQIKNNENLALHIGIATGNVVVGNMGSDLSKSFTVMGNTVNIASRLKGAAQYYGVTVLLPETTHSQLHASIETREIDWIRVVGKDEPVRIYELLGLRIDLSLKQMEFKAHFEQGLTAYRQQQWQSAKQYFNACLASKGEDQPCCLFLQRIEDFSQNPPSKDWDGVWQMVQK